MVRLTRRSFLASTSVIPFAVWLERNALGRPQTPLVRYDALSTQGQAMLKVYAQGVAKMKALPEGDPTGWIFQWYSHSVKGSTSKDAEIARIYPSQSANRDLAEATWSTCQAHDPSDEENNFLPWHRAFVYFFERIIRNQTGYSAFTLPYWNYSTSNQAVRGVLPPQFRMQGDPTFGPLFVQNRNPGVNNGQPIQQGQPGDPLSLSSLADCTYESNPATGDPGFCLDLDQGLHGNVHVLVGNGVNMASIPWAANDPIFWMHHCNIDRLWTSWSAGGRTSPALSPTFIFADESGQRVEAKLADFLDPARLGYSYDALEPVPACPQTRVIAEAVQGAQVKKHATVAAPVALTSQAVRVALNPLPVPEAAHNLTARVQALPPGKRLYLIVKDLRAEAQPGVLYHVYLDVPEGATPEKMKAQYVGPINFFNAVGHSRKGHGGAPAKGHGEAAKKVNERFVRFDVTDLSKQLQARGMLSEKPTLTIAPVGKPAEDAKPVIGDISLVEQ